MYLHFQEESIMWWWKKIWIGFCRNLLKWSNVLSLIRVDIRLYFSYYGKIRPLLFFICINVLSLCCEHKVLNRIVTWEKIDYYIDFVLFYCDFFYPVNSFFCLDILAWIVLERKRKRLFANYVFYDSIYSW